MSQAASASTARVTAGERATLLHMVEEEKLAHDVYVVLGRRYDLPIFGHIADSETRHQSAVSGLLDRYRIDDPTDDTRLGEFVDPTLQALYAELVAQGRKSLAAALGVGIIIEKTDIADLKAALQESTHADIDRVYGNLLAGSRNHLEAFRTVR
jgi:hypothetical protein